MEPTVTLIATFAAGVISGLGLACILKKGCKLSKNEDLSKTKRKHSEYQNRVNVHFNRTASLLEDLDHRVQLMKEHVFHSSEVIGPETSEENYEQRADYAVAQAILDQAAESENIQQRQKDQGL